MFVNIFQKFALKSSLIHKMFYDFYAIGDFFGGGAVAVSAAPKFRQFPRESADR